MKKSHSLEIWTAYIFTLCSFPPFKLSCNNLVVTFSEELMGDVLALRNVQQMFLWHLLQGLMFPEGFCTSLQKKQMSTLSKRIFTFLSYERLFNPSWWRRNLAEVVLKSSSVHHPCHIYNPLVFTHFFLLCDMDLGTITKLLKTFKKSTK